MIWSMQRRRSDGVPISGVHLLISGTHGPDPPSEGWHGCCCKEGEAQRFGAAGRNARANTTEVKSMRKQTWVQLVVAAILVVIAGAFIASADERIEIRVEKESADLISVDVNGVTEVVRLEDLADGESRTFDVGDHELVVKRVGDDLTIINDGHAFGSFGAHGEGHSTNVWVTDDGEDIEITGDCEFSEKKIIVMKVDGLGGEDGEVKTYTIHVDGDEVLLDGEHNIEIDEIMNLHEGHHGAVFISKDGDVNHPMIIKSHGMHAGLVKYLCEETGSILMVKQEDALEDAYICPATGCVMTKVDEPEVRVIKIQKRIEIDE
jgi:hypothetical protein